MKNYEIYEDARDNIFRDNLKRKKVVDKDNKTYTNVGVSFENYIWNEPNTLLFKNDNKEPYYNYKTKCVVERTGCGFNYVKMKNNELSGVLDFDRLFEVICGGMDRKLFIDWDGGDSLISYNEAERLCNDFKEFLIKIYKVKGDIKYCIQGSVEDDFVFLLNDNEANAEYNKNRLNAKLFKSLHIIFNVYTKTHTEAKIIVSEFLTTNTAYTDQIDRSVYCNMKLMRAIKQRKNKQNRTDKLQVLNTWNYEERIDKQYTIQGLEKLKSGVKLDNTDIITAIKKETRPIIKDYFITAISDTDILLKVEKDKMPSNIDINTKYNIHYNINQLGALKKHINALKYDDLHIQLKPKYKNNWSNNLFLIINCLLLCGVKRVDICNNEYIQLFLKVSKEKSTEDKYNNEASVIKNTEYINNICNNGKQIRRINSKKFITEISEGEKGFIYRMLGKDNNEELTITNRTINNEAYIEITTEGNTYDSKKTNDLILYNTRRFILLVGAKINDLNVISGQTKKIHSITTTAQYHYVLDTFEKTEHLSFTRKKAINFKEWSEITTDIYENAYYEASVGSGKSYNRMCKDITAIIKTPMTRLLIVGDTINLCLAQHERSVKLVKEYNESVDDHDKIDISKVKHYSEYSKKPHEVNDENTLIFVVCYDSLDKYTHLNFTHVILDEYLNIRKRFTKIGGENGGNSNKIHALQTFFKKLQKAECVKCYDADLQKHDLDLLSQFSKKKYNYYRLTDYIQNNNTIKLYNHNKAIDEILQYASENKNLTISSTIKKKAVKLYDDILTANKNIKMAIITGEGAIDTNNKKWSKSLKEKLIRDTTIWSDYNIVIYTPTIMTGISFDLLNYFEKHYAFCCVNTTDYTQTAQMIFRIRNTIQNEIVICDIEDSVNSFYDYKQTTDEISKECYYEDIFINMQNVNSGITQEHLTEQYNNYKKQNENNVLVKYIELDETQERRRKQFYYDFFYTLKKWGCNKLKCEFYNSIEGEEYIYKRKHDEEYKKVDLIETMVYEDFLKLDFIDKISKTEEENDDEENAHVIKTKILRSFGYGGLIFNKYKNDATFNRLLFNIYTSYNERKTYSRMNKLTLYNLRELIYDMLKIVYVNIGDLQELFLKQKRLKEQNYFLEWLVNSYVFFKLVDFIKKQDEADTSEADTSEADTSETEEIPIYDNTYETIMREILELDESEIIIEETDNFVNEIKATKPIIDLLVNKNIRKDNTIQTTLKEVFDYFYCFNATILTEQNTTEIKYKRRGIPLRYEREKYNIEMGEHSLTSTDYDDYKNWVNVNTKYRTDMNTTINNNFTPKIKCYNYGNAERGENEKLRHYITTYFSVDNQAKLLDKLDKITETEMKRQTKIDKHTAEEIWDNRIINDDNEEEDKYETYTNIEGEIFREFNEEYYKISNFGRVLYNKDSNDLRILKSYCLDIPLTKERINETFKVMGTKYDKDIKIKSKCVIINKVFYFVDRLVAEAFVETYRADYHIKHLNNNYADDRTDNLFMCEEWSRRQYGEIIDNLKDDKKQKTKDKVKVQRATEKYICEKCNKEGLKIHIARHLKTCKGNISKASKKTE